MKKRLSIVIPVYNLEKYIGQCLDSCINQDVDFDQYEILCIDDGSKDKSLSIMKKYENKYKNIKSNIINYITFMFPCEIYFKIFHRIASKIIQKKYIREK